MGVIITYAVFIGNDEYTCRTIFELGKGRGIDIHDVEGKYIGAIFGVSIPDIDCDVAETARFEEIVTNYIESL